MNTRTDAEGNKVLFLEEVQSDWGQKGKKDGFVEKDLQNSESKFSQYQLSGEKENYKEVLVTMPSRKVSEYSIKERPPPRGVGVMYDVVHNKTNRVVSISHRSRTGGKQKIRSAEKRCRSIQILPLGRTQRTCSPKNEHPNRQRW